MNKTENQKLKMYEQFFLNEDVEYIKKNFSNYEALTKKIKEINQKFYERLIEELETCFDCGELRKNKKLYEIHYFKRDIDWIEEHFESGLMRKFIEEKEKWQQNLLIGEIKKIKTSEELKNNLYFYEIYYLKKDVEKIISFFDKEKELITFIKENIPTSARSLVLKELNLRLGKEKVTNNKGIYFAWFLNEDLKKLKNEVKNKERFENKLKTMPKKYHNFLYKALSKRISGKELEELKSAFELEEKNSEDVYRSIRKTEDSIGKTEVQKNKSKEAFDREKKLEEKSEIKTRIEDITEEDYEDLTEEIGDEIFK